MLTESGSSMAAEKELVITRVFDAPRELVFKAWTQAEHVKHWWGPKDYTMPYVTLDPRPGGKMHFCMRSPGGEDIWCLGEYREIVAPERIVSTDCFSDKDGNIVDPVQYGMPPEWPREGLVTLVFLEQRGKTELTINLGVPESLADRVGARQGWDEMLDRLAEYVAGL